MREGLSHTIHEVVDSFEQASEDLQNIQAMLNDLKSTDDYEDTEATHTKIIEELHEMLEEASPEIKAKLYAEIEKLQGWLNKLQADDAAQSKDSFVELHWAPSPDRMWGKPKEGLTTVGEEVESAVGVTP